MVGLLYNSCIFKSNPYRGVMSYRNQKVYIQGGGFYKVGKLPQGWERMHASSKAISFYNKSYDSSITTDVFCGREFSDRPLEVLAGEFASALANKKVIFTDNIMLSERGALRLSVSGKMDGVDVGMDIVVVKRNGCNFDFVAVTDRKSVV